MKRLGFYTFLLGLLAVASWLTFAGLTVRRCARDGLCIEGRTLAQWQGDLKSSGSLERRTDAIRALPRFGPRAVPGLIEALKDPHPEVREHAAAALGRFGPAASEAVPTLLTQALQDLSPGPRYYAISALESIGPVARRAAAPDLRRLAAEDADPGVRQMAAHALGKLNGD